MDIQAVHREIEFDVLIQLCSKINDKTAPSSSLSKSIQLLQWLNHTDYLNGSLTSQHRKNYSIFVSKMLSHCHSLDQLLQIESLLPIPDRDIFINTSMMSKYAHFGIHNKVQSIYDEIPDTQKDSVCVNSMMNSLLNIGSFDKVLSIYDQFREDNAFRNNPVFYILALKSCIATNEFNRGKLIHSEVNKSLCSETKVATVLIDFYGHFGDSSTALSIFNHISGKKKDRIMIASMMKCLINNGDPNKALEIYDSFHGKVDDVLHSLALKASTLCGDYHRGHKHLDAVLGSQSETQSDPFSASYRFNGKHDDLVVSTVIEFYGHFGEIENAMNLFDSVPLDRNSVVIVGAILKVLVHNDRNIEALSIYSEFDRSSNLIDNRSHVLALKAAANLKDERAVRTGNDIIGRYFRDTASLSIEVLTTMIDFYGETGHIRKALDIFECISESKRNIQCYNAMMNSYCLNEMDGECMAIFETIKHRTDLTSNTFQIALKATTQSTLLYHGTGLYHHLQDYYPHLLSSDVAIQVCLIGMFGKCGQIEACKRIFDEIRRTDYKRYSTEIRLWHAIIHALGRNGDIKDAMKSYYIMTDGVGLTADYKVFLLLLSSCGNSGEIGIARELWGKEIGDEMRKYVVSVYVDCLSRAGFVHEAYGLALEYDEATRVNKEKDNQTMWMSVLNAFVKKRDQEMARNVFDEIEQRYSNDERHNDFMAAASQLICNVFGP